ncbi:NAD(P)-binding domain-containing protein [Ramlibacter sp.]|uniref:NAD(P)-dependent oxidoreductase n=1 Tax=Ramlibacter sp. TaxID=1917967 RepID=UPI0017A6A602|nr:NAD(P)-dependent oxidoreductase [Ramlibacter sp.]
MDITVMGLGMMGSTLARLLLRAGHRVTVFNRTPEKAAALQAQGAHVAPDAAAAVAAGSVVVASVSDSAAARDMLGAPEVQRHLAGKTIVQLSTGSPQDALDFEAWATQHGANFLCGAIQAAPAQMGLPDTPIIVSGSRAAFDAAKPALDVFGGNIEDLGTRASLASAMDLATLSYVYGAILGLLQGACVAEAEGLPVERLGALVSNISATFGPFLHHEAKVIASGDFKASESPLRISVDATERIAQHARGAGIHAGLPMLAAELFRKASQAGWGDQEAAAVVKLMRAQHAGAPAAA